MPATLAKRSSLQLQPTPGSSPSGRRSSGSSGSPPGLEAAEAAGAGAGVAGVDISIFFEEGATDFEQGAGPATPAEGWPELVSPQPATVMSSAKLARIEVRSLPPLPPFHPLLPSARPSPPHATGPSSPHRRATITITTAHHIPQHTPHTPHYTPLQEACELIGATELAAAVVSILREEEEAEEEQPPPPSPQAEAGITA